MTLWVDGTNVVYAPNTSSIGPLSRRECRWLALGADGTPVGGLAASATAIDEAVRSALCGVLDRLGGDGTTSYMRGVDADSLSDAIWEHVRDEIEEREIARVREECAKIADVAGEEERAQQQVRRHLDAGHGRDVDGIGMAALIGKRIRASADEAGSTMRPSRAPR